MKPLPYSLLLTIFYLLVCGCKTTSITPVDAYWEGNGGFAHLQGDVFRYNDSYWKVTYETNDSIRVWPLQHSMHMTVKFDRDAKIGTETKLYFRQDTITFTVDATRFTPPDSIHMPYYLKQTYADSVCTEQYMDGKWVDPTGIIWWFSNPKGAKNQGVYQLIHFKSGTKEFKEFIVMTVACDTMYLMLETARAVKYKIHKLNNRQMAVVQVLPDGTVGQPINLIRTADQQVDLNPYYPQGKEAMIAYYQDSTLVPTLAPVVPFDTLYDFSRQRWIPRQPTP